MLDKGKIENYQVVTPTAWNIGPRDGDGVLGPIEQALVGTPITDMQDPGQTRPSHDHSTRVWCVHRLHAYDGSRVRIVAVRGQQDGLRSLICVLANPTVLLLAPIAR